MDFDQEGEEDFYDAPPYYDAPPQAHSIVDFPLDLPYADQAHLLLRSKIFSWFSPLITLDSDFTNDSLNYVYLYLCTPPGELPRQSTLTDQFVESLVDSTTWVLESFFLDRDIFSVVEFIATQWEALAGSADEEEEPDFLPLLAAEAGVEEWVMVRAARRVLVSAMEEYLGCTPEELVDMTWLMNLDHSAPAAAPAAAPSPAGKGKGKTKTEVKLTPQRVALLSSTSSPKKKKFRKRTPRKLQTQKKASPATNSNAKPVGPPGPGKMSMSKLFSRTSPLDRPGTRTDRPPVTRQPMWAAEKEEELLLFGIAEDEDEDGRGGGGEGRGGGGGGGQGARQAQLGWQGNDQPEEEIL